MCTEIKELYVDYPFLKEVDSCSLRCAVFNLEDAFKNCFSKRSNYPRFKSNIINKVIELHVLGEHIKIENIVIWN